MRRTILIILALLLTSAFVVYWNSDYRSNNLNMADLRSQLRSIKHFAGVKVIREVDNFGILMENSNHCDYFVAVEIESESSLSELKMHYKQQKIIDPVSHKQEALSIVKMDDPAFKKSIPLIVQKSWAASEPKKAHVVFFYESHPPNSDLRCH